MCTVVAFCDDFVDVQLRASAVLVGLRRCTPKGILTEPVELVQNWRNAERRNISFMPVHVRVVVAAVRRNATPGCSRMEMRGRHTSALLGTGLSAPWLQVRIFMM